MPRVMLATNFVVSRRENYNNTVRPAWPVARCQANRFATALDVRSQRMRFVPLQYPQSTG
jgi:hypothetical protein